MKIPLKTNSLPFILVLTFNVIKKCAIRVIASDNAWMNTNYVNSRYEVKPGQQSIKINFPLSGVVTNLEINCECDGVSNGSCMQLTDIQTMPLPIKQIYLTPADAKYFSFLKEFVQQSGALAPGIYQNKDHTATIELYDIIKDKNGKELKTPARVDHDSGVVQISKKAFDQFSVPMRMFIGAHERVHYSYNTTNEMDCDKNAVNITKAWGFPKLETLYAATKIFPDDATSRARTLNIDQLLNTE